MEFLHVDNVAGQTLVVLVARGWRSGQAWLGLDPALAVDPRALVIAAPGVLGNDFDVDGDDLSVLLVSGPSPGLLTLGTDGSFI